MDLYLKFCPRVCRHHWLRGYWFPAKAESKILSLPKTLPKSHFCFFLVFLWQQPSNLFFPCYVFVVQQSVLFKLLDSKTLTFFYFCNYLILFRLTLLLDNTRLLHHAAEHKRCDDFLHRFHHAT